MYAPVYYKQGGTLFEKLNFLLFLSPRWLTGCYLKYAEVAELVDAHDSKSCISRCVGSIPTFGTNGEFFFFKERFPVFFLSKTRAAAAIEKIIELTFVVR